VLGGTFGDGVSVVISNLVQIGIRVPETRARKNPMEIRMRQSRCVSAARAIAAGNILLAAKELLRDPDG